MEDRKHVDFISSIVVFLLSVYVIIESLRIHADAGEILYESPGLVPLMMGCGLLLCAVLLCVRSVRGSGAKENMGRVRAGAAEFLKSATFRKALTGLAVMALYIFVLLPNLHFIAASLIFLIGMMVFLRVGGIPKILLISVLVTGITYVVFTMVFGVPLP